MVAAVPPVSWITSSSTGRPLASTMARRPSRSKLSQPSETSTTPPTLGWLVTASITRRA
jgi:hypothetical protein